MTLDRNAAAGIPSTPGYHCRSLAKGCACATTAARGLAPDGLWAKTSTHVLAVSAISLVGDVQGCPSESTMVKFIIFLGLPEKWLLHLLTFACSRTLLSWFSSAFPLTPCIRAMCRNLSSSLSCRSWLALRARLGGRKRRSRKQTVEGNDNWQWHSGKY